MYQPGFSQIFLHPFPGFVSLCVVRKVLQSDVKRLAEEAQNRISSAPHQPGVSQMVPPKFDTSQHWFPILDIVNYISNY